MACLFISQERLDAWSVEDRVTVEGDTMTLAENGRSFTIRPAVHFLQVEGGDEDPQQLVGLVKDEETLATMGADHYITSVIIGDVAYKVNPGFLGTPTPKA